MARLPGWHSLFPLWITVALLGTVPAWLSAEERGDDTGVAPDAPAGSAATSLEELDERMAALYRELGVAFWLATDRPGPDAEKLADYAERRLVTTLAEGLAGLDPAPAGPEQRRRLLLLQHRSERPLPRDPARRETLNRAARELARRFLSARYCPANGSCRGRAELEGIMRTSGDPAERLAAWQAWRQATRPLRDAFEQQVKRLNLAARDWGYSDLGEWWLAAYEMPSAEFIDQSEALWRDVEPLYGALHCFTRERLHRRHGQHVARSGPIPAHLVGDMWSQDWTPLGGVLADGLPPRPLPDDAIEKAFGDNREMALLADGFFQTLGYAPLPPDFWERSVFDRDTDGDGDCEPSGWNVDGHSDVRVSMCGKVDSSSFFWLHRTLAQLHYDLAFAGQDWVYRTAPRPGFAQANSGAALLALTPAYLHGLGLLEELPGPGEELSRLLFEALDTLPELPFMLAADRWRWDVYSGKIGPGEYNRYWWELRRRYQGVAPPEPRENQAFDAGAKLHIPFNLPLMPDYYGAFLRYQFHAISCRRAGFQGPLHQCSMAGNKAAGEALRRAQSLGASRPWPDVLEALGGGRRVEADSLLEYFSPIREWLDRQNEGLDCGW